MTEPHPSAAPFRPCFIVGCERSGTTLLAVLLGRHSQLAITPETHFLSLVPRHLPTSPLTHQQLLDRLFASRHTADLKLDRANLAARFSSMPATYPALFRAVLEEFSANDGGGKPRVGEKTPLHLLRVPTLLSWYPDARIICIVRDGRDVVLSLMNMPWGDEHRLRPLALVWMRLLRFAEKYRRRFPDLFLLIRYEDLLNAPEQILAQIDTFVGLAHEARQFDTSVQTHVVPDVELPWKGLALEKIDRSRMGAWKNTATTEQQLIMNTMMARDLRRLGYADVDLPHVSPVKRLAAQLANIPYRAGIFTLWQKLISRNLPAARAKRRATRAS